MLSIIERRITLQLLVFYCLFVIPLILGGMELFFFQRDALQQSAQQADLNLAQMISFNIASHVQGTANEATALSQSQAAKRLDAHQLPSLFAAAALAQPAIRLFAACDLAGKTILAYSVGQRHTDGQRGQGGVGTKGGIAVPQTGFPCGQQYSSALNNDRPFISLYRTGDTTNAGMITFASRILNDKRRIVGVMMLDEPVTIFASYLMTMRQQLLNGGEAHIWLVDQNGQSIANTVNISPASSLLQRLPALKRALSGKSGSLLASVANQEWLYSYVPISGTSWTIVVQRLAGSIFAVVSSFQSSLVIALIMLMLGASFFWFAMHGWVVTPLTKLAQAVTGIRPDQMTKVTESKLLARERGRSDEIGQLITAISTMEEEIHSLFRKSDEQSQARLHTLDAIMRSMDEGVLLERPDGQIVYANRSFMRFVGISPQETIPENFLDSHLSEKILDLIEDPETSQEAIRRAEDGSGPQVVEFRLRGHYNQVGQLVPVRRDIRMRLFYVRDQAGQVIGRGKIFHDVTRQNEAEMVKKNLLAIVSHELRTPLTSIKGYATSLLETDVELDEALQRLFLRRIVEEGDRMGELVTSLLEMSQLEAGTLKLYPALYRLEVLLEPFLATDEQQHLRVLVPEQLPLLYVDRRRMEVVLGNILENARRYAGSGAHIEITARYEEEQANDAAGLYLSIADNGAGIPPHLTQRIFESFYQVDSGRERGSSGVGLGLAICRGFIEAHGGRIWAENRTGGETGAIFSIWLPPKVLRTRYAQPDLFTLNNAL